MSADELALLAQVREALEQPCGHSRPLQNVMTPYRLRDCPTCLPERIAAMAEYLYGTLDEPWDGGVLAGAIRLLRGER